MQILLFVGDIVHLVSRLGRLAIQYRRRQTTFICNNPLMHPEMQDSRPRREKKKDISGTGKAIYGGSEECGGWWGGMSIELEPSSYAERDNEYRVDQRIPG
jgi:hypothetical protein